ncbi:MAG TPA: nucleoside hydrolase [Candidatus Faecaligallichristensenella faecipullorum]|nr:nucleoside hydrolase [Candidatus Faecaligallichristensenella faecipullorum]
MKWNPMPAEKLIPRLRLPGGKLNMVLDTDTYNEVDDQFALCYSLLSRERLNVQAVYAAPFFNDRSSGPEDGMEKSYDEIVRLLGTMNLQSQGFVFKGSRSYLPGEDTPVISPAAEDLVKKGMGMPEGELLYVTAIGAITNVASALLMEPRLVEKICVIWLGGHPLTWPTAREFNLMQDVKAARVILNSGVPFILVPCMGVASHLTASIPELEAFLGGKNEMCDALVKLFSEYTDDPFGWAKEIWDVSTIGLLVNPDWAPMTVEPSPLLSEDCRWSRDASRHPIGVVQWLNRNAIFRDMYKKLAQGV